VYLSSLTLKGFKSFPDRTRLEFGRGVSVVVGPNGSGKSNVTDAVLWALGEQSPLAVRGQSMQDVIFGGGHGVQARQSAEVELVLDNSDGTVDLPVGEISIMRRLDRSGEGEYRLNGARCRLVDVIEILSDTGLGKEMHSVISQGRVEAIVSSKPRDRRMLIEEAAGLGKHRKRRRRAQLKLERTQENLDRALDIEREARSRLRPLKRQAEAAELHARIERQTLETRWELARDVLRARRVELTDAETAAQTARDARAEIDARLQDVIARREAAEEALAQRSEQREALGRRVYAARSADERLALRLEQAQATVATLTRRRQRSEVELETLTAGDDESTAAEELAQSSRVAALEAELAELARRRDADLQRELSELQEAREYATAAAEQADTALLAQRERRSTADAEADAARVALRAAEQEVEAARRAAARVGSQLAAVNQFLRGHAGPPGGAATLSDELTVAPGYELALAAALGGRLGAGLADDLPGANRLLDGAGPDGGATIIAPTAPAAPASSRAAAPLPGAEPLLDLVRGDGLALAVASLLLADAWVVDDLAALPPDFGGIAVTRAGRAWFALSGPEPADGQPVWGEVRQVAAGGVDLVLSRRNERERLIAESETAAQTEVTARQAVEQAATAVAQADRVRDDADRDLRAADRHRAEALEAVRRCEWLIDERRRAPEQGPGAVRRAELEGELVAERRQAERAERERAERRRRRERLRAQLAVDVVLIPLAERLVVVLGHARRTIGERVVGLEQELAGDRAAGESVSAALRACATEEAKIHGELRTQGEAVTHAEVAAQRLRDQAAEAEHELVTISERLGLAPVPAETALEPEQSHGLTTRLERLQRRREQLGPVNPLAQGEYAEALEHVEELETRRADLETALRELRTLIRDTDRQIEETFEATFSAAATNFEALVGDVFPGGRGRLRLVREDAGPRPVLGGQAPPASEEDGAAESEAAADAEAGLDDGDETADKEDLLGVEIEITPAGKSAKRLSLLSGGEKSMTALAFMFAVFLAKPCPFYILDEVEAALDDLNLDRFLALLGRHSGRAQFIVITHQKRTMEAADTLYGVSMGGDGVSKVISRRLPPSEPAPEVAAADAVPGAGVDAVAGVA